MSSSRKSERLKTSKIPRVDYKALHTGRPTGRTSTLSNNIPTKSLTENLPYKGDPEDLKDSCLRENLEVVLENIQFNKNALKTESDILDNSISEVQNTIQQHSFSQSEEDDTTAIAVTDNLQQNLTQLEVRKQLNFQNSSLFDEKVQNALANIRRFGDYSLPLTEFIANRELSREELIKTFHALDETEVVCDNIDFSPFENWRENIFEHQQEELSTSQHDSSIPISHHIATNDFVHSTPQISKFVHNSLNTPTFFENIANMTLEFDPTIFGSVMQPSNVALPLFLKHAPHVFEDLHDNIIVYAKAKVNSLPADTKYVELREHLKLLIDKTATKLSNELDTEENVDTVFFLLQKLVKYAWDETVFTYIIISNDKTSSSKENVQQRVPIYKDHIDTFNQGQFYLQTMGYKMAVLGETIPIFILDKPQPFHTKALMTGYDDDRGATALPTSSDQQIQRDMVQVLKDFKDISIDTGEKGKVPTFSGGATKWFTFWHQFDVLVDKNPKLSPSAKFNKLLESLEGPPAECVRKFLFEPDNYEAAKKALKLEFGNDRKIASELWHSVLSFRPIQAGNVNQYRDFSTAAVQAVRYMQKYMPNELKQQIYTFGSLKKKLPWNDKMAWENYLLEMEAGKNEEQLEEIHQNKLVHFVNWLENHAKKQMRIKDSDMSLTSLIEQSSRTMAGSSNSPRGRGSYQRGRASRRGRGTYQNVNTDRDEMMFNTVATPAKPATTPIQTSSRGNTFRGRRGRGNGQRGRGRGNARMNTSTASPPSNTTTSTQQRRPFTSKCFLCKSTEHQTQDCQFVKRYQPDELLTIFKNASVCVNCLKYGHNVKNCQTPQQCTKCKHYHHTLVHTINQQITNANKQSTQNSK